MPSLQRGERILYRERDKVKGTEGLSVKRSERTDEEREASLPLFILHCESLFRQHVGVPQTVEAECVTSPA